MAVSQKQIAEKLGVSIALVSRVLSGKAAEIGITQAKIEQVLKTADEMGYVPSAAALSLIGKSTRTIGIAVYDFNDPFFGTLIKEIQNQARTNGYSLVLTGFLNRTPDRNDLEPLHKHSLDGLIVIGTDTEAGWLEDFNKLPVARIGHGGMDEKSTRISVDEESAAAKLISHLVDSGRREIVYLCADLPAHRIRFEGLTKAAAKHSINIHCVFSLERGAFAAGQEATPRALESFPGVDALLCATDRVAMGALHALHNQGVAAPGKIAVTGFDDVPAASEFIPPITTIRQPVRKMVEQAFRAVMMDEAPGIVDFSGELMIREST